MRSLRVRLALAFALVAALVVERTRWWAIGFLAGAATVLIVLAGACVVILVAVLGSSG